MYDARGVNSVPLIGKTAVCSSRAVYIPTALLLVLIALQKQAVSRAAILQTL